MTPIKNTLGAIAAFALAFPMIGTNASNAAGAAAAVIVQDIRCEYQREALGIDTPKPRLFWRLADARRGARQTAYQIVVAETAEALHAGKDLLWDTGKVDSERSIQIEYGGKPLASWKRYWWKVRAWDMNGEASAWSEPGWWETAALSPKDWKADWIVMKPQPTHKKDGEKDDLGDWLYAANLRPYVYGHEYNSVNQHFRKDMDLPDNGAITAARLLVDTKNPCKIWMNGQVIVDELSGRKPAPRAIVITDAQAECRRQSDSRSRIQTFDAAPFLRKGKNTLAVELLREPDLPTSAFRGVMVCTLASGERLAVPTDTTWRVRMTGGGMWCDFFSKEDSERWFLPDWIATKFEPKLWSSATSTGDIHPLDYRRAALFRKQFIVKPGIASARIYASALGVYEVFINGQRVGRDELTPGRSSLSNEPGWKKGREHLVQYQVYDVTHLLKEGENVMAAQVCNGWWNGGNRNIDCHPPAWFAELAVRHGKGETQWVRTDGSWKSSPSPVVFDALGWGETYDARLEQPGWNAPGFDDHHWDAVRSQKFEPTPELISQLGPPCRVTETLPPIAIQRQGDAYTIDFAQLLSGWCRLTIHNAPPGTVLRLKSTDHNEKGLDEYICRGAASETWRVRSRYNNFTSVVLTGFPGELKPEQIAMEVVHDDLPEAGTFTCSNEVVNRLWRGIRRTLRSNLQSVVQDGAREKQLWAAEAQLSNRVMCWMMDSAAYNARFVRLFGGGYTMGGDSPAWVDSIFTHPWNSFVLYGDTSVAERAYGDMRLIADKRAKSQDGVYFSSVLEDWFPVESARKGMAGAFWQYLSTKRLSRLAEALGKEEDARRYAEMLPVIAEGFNRKFLDRTQALYDGNLQKSYALPVYLGIVPDDLWPRISEKLERSVAALDQEMAARNPKLHEELRNSKPVGYSLDDHPTVSPHTAPFLLHALTSAGHHETAYRMLTQETRPSWGYMVADDRMGMCEMYGRGGSHTGHCSIGDWIFETLGGIRADARYPGLTRFLVKPQPAGDLKAAKASYNSLHGRIESDWRLDEKGDFSLRTTIPPNTEALVFLPLPAKGTATITEGGVPVEKAKGVHPADIDTLPSLLQADASGRLTPRERELLLGKARAFRVDAGTYDFRVTR